MVGPTAKGLLNLAFLSENGVCVRILYAHGWTLTILELKGSGTLVTAIRQRRGDLKVRTLLTTMIQVLAPFAPLFCERIFQHIQLLVMGTMLAPGT